MRSARMLFATAAATAVLAITAPGAYADGDEWDRGDHGYSKEHHKDGRHEGPRGGVHTGGGALSAIQNDEWSPEGKEDKSWGAEDKQKDEGRKESWKGDSDKESWKGDHDKPRGGMHTGGGALASPAMTAGGLAVLAVAGTGMYALRRKNLGGSAA